MKPIVRWTIGSVKQAGFRCLLFSINNFVKLYGDAFDYYIMCNNINFPYSINKINIISQEKLVNKLLKRPTSVSWKLYPSRINVDTSEIFIDNDLILTKRLPEIDDLLNLNIPFMTEGFNRNFGKYDKFINSNYVLNSGFFSFPIGFDLSLNKINDYDSYYDEQGLVALAITSFKKFNIIPCSKIGICRSIDRLPNSSHGYHFCGLNNTGNLHNGWIKFIEINKIKIKLI